MSAAPDSEWTCPRPADHGQRRKTRPVDRGLEFGEQLGLGGGGAKSADNLAHASLIEVAVTELIQVVTELMLAAGVLV